MDRRRFVGTLLGAGTGLVLGRGRSHAAGLLWEAGEQSAAPIVGINSHVITDEVIAQLRDLGITHVRNTLLWPYWERNFESYPVAYAEAVERATRAGLKLLVVVHNWPGGSRVFKSGVNRDMMRRFARFVAARAAQFPQVEAWQLWNEQDMWWQAPFGASSGLEFRQRGRHYAEQLELAYPLIKKANPRALVVSGGTADHPEAGYADFLRGMMESRPPVDAVAVHAYGPWSRARSLISRARGIVDGHAPIWVTECGNDRPDRFDPDHQRNVWQSVIEGNRAERLAARLYPYALQTDPNDPGHGLFDVRGRPRPVYRWLKQSRRG